MRRLLLALGLLALMLGGAAPAVGQEGGVHADPGAAGVETDEHSHGAGDTAQTAQDVEDSGHLPVQAYSLKAYFESPWRDPRSLGRLNAQTGVVLLVDAALLAWLWKRWWRR